MNKLFKIGKVVLDVSCYTGNDQYSDGSIENEILEALKTGNAEELLHGDTRWPIVYHLSTVRHHLLDCINFKPNANVLEIGCGCGAISGVLCQKAAKVDAVEISPRRAEIAAYRNKNYTNLTIHVGNLNDMKFKEKYDYVTLIGVLEYAGLFTKTSNPWQDFLENCRQYLKPDGTLIIAIENRLGMKYWSGASEDHTGKRFDGITGYQNNRSIRTFSRKELKDLLKLAGFYEIQWFYPYPDYKMPADVYSDKCIPTTRDLLSIINVPYDRDRYELYSEVGAYINLIDTGLFTEFANSFLVLCNQYELETQCSQPIYIHHSERRKNNLRVGTMLIERNGKKIIQKIALNDESKDHLRIIAENCQILNKEYGSEHVAQSWLINDNLLEMEYIEGITMEELAVKALSEDGVEGLVEYIQFYLDHLLRGNVGSNYNVEFNFKNPNRRYNMDTHLRNIICCDNKYVFIDYEFLLPNVPKEYLFWRMLTMTFRGYGFELNKQGIDMQMLYESANISQDKVKFYTILEEQFYKSVLDQYLNNYVKKRHFVSLDIMQD